MPDASEGTQRPVQYQWATRCVDCKDGPRLHDREGDARASFEADARSEARMRDKHRVQLIRRAVPEWEVVDEVPGV